MIVFDLVNTESHQVYQDLQISNGNRHYDFLHSIVKASLDMGKPFLSQEVIKALNFHAITCLHINAGQYRPCGVTVGLGTPLEFHPVDFYRVPPLMDDFVNTVNRWWDTTDPILLATYVLWRINNIHPFINGNGRTARAACYFVLCLKQGGLIRGTKILPELLNQNHNEYCQALQLAHQSFAVDPTKTPDLSKLFALVTRLVDEQIKSAPTHSAGSTQSPKPNPNGGMYPGEYEAVARHGKLPPRRHEELPPPWLAEERADARGANHGKPIVE